MDAVFGLKDSGFGATLKKTKKSKQDFRCSLVKKILQARKDEDILEVCQV